MNHDLVEMFREKLDSLTISDYHGLNSPGLTCYLNSVLQVLFMTKDFREAVERCCNEESTTIDPQLRRLFADLQRRMAKTHNVTKKLGITNVYKQRDAAEYFEKILCLTSPEAAKIFKGELNHMTTCLRCDERNDSRSFFWILPLVVEDLRHQTYSVEKGLKAFFKGETVCGDNKMFCNRCNKKQDTDFECEMTQNPEILTLLLKRFSFDYKLRCYVKLHCEVDVPQTLHMKDCKYDLYALVNHFGNLTGGHYTAHIKSFETDMWYHFNDDIVNRVKQPLFGARDNSLRSNTAYLLMYRKVSRHPEKMDEGGEEALCSDVDAEVRHDEAERGEPFGHHHQLMDESCNRGENLKHLNGNILKKSHDDTVWKKPTNLSGEKQLNQRAARVRPHKEILLCVDRQQLDTNSEEHMWHLNTRGTPTVPLRTHQLDRILEQNLISSNKRLNVNDTVWETQNNIVVKTGTASANDSSLTRNGIKPSETKVVKNKREAVAEVGIEGKSAKQKRDAGIVCDSDGIHVSSNGYSSSSVPYWTGHIQSPFSMHEPVGCNYSPDLYRKSNLSKRGKEIMPHVVTADSRWKPETKDTVKKGEKTASPRERTAAKSSNNAKREPWRC